MTSENSLPEGPKAIHGAPPFTLRTFDGFGVGDRDKAFEDLESAIRAFIDTPPTRLPRLRAGDRTVLELDPEAGLLPVFWSDDGSVEAIFHRLMAARQAARAAAGAVAQQTECGMPAGNTPDMRSGKFPDARCDASVVGFVVRLVLPRHPDAPDVDNLYPCLCDGGYFAWMEQQSGVLDVRQREVDGGTVFDLSVLSDACALTPEAFASHVRDRLNEAGFQW